ncbi:tRNA pseudouridine(13) synthase TruD [Lysobacter sp. A03]|uniref:tRNA pseudouridine(13) synthase TruD n=1 Tax=Lysobacter sp. A03 TaxID=1199154 RepID=UPI0005B6FD0E|nr:tRNA pseudouridine(13) synthase TruD [Lysobacter sp. A03]KIQ98168.1 tRNA pseudouridine 13 synthase [Lysobacter sp. A03]
MSDSAAQDAAGDASPAEKRAHGEPVLSARMRVSPEDFFVEELAGFEPSGSGEHLLLTVEKRGMNTAFAARSIAQWAGVDERAIGYAGLKDRHAVTRQRFSVHLPRKTAPAITALQVDGLQVLEQAWHAKKLPRGALAGNRFVLVLRDVVGDPTAIDARLQQIAARGVPNFFGEQRFGRDGNNLGKALAMFEGRRVRREERGMLLSAARSALFNQVLQARVDAHCWDAPLTGEVWMLDGSRSVFGPEPISAEIEQRLAAFDIHPSGPLWGRGKLRSKDDALELEQVALADPVSMRIRAGLEQAGLKQERRSLRLRADALGWQWRDPATLELSFSLPPGTYATVVLAELGAVSDASGQPGP